MKNLLLDHIVIAVPNLEEAIHNFQKILGVYPTIGGKHPDLGTHNAIIGLGNQDNLAYLELLAIDPDDKNHRDTYTMGLSTNMQRPYIASWSLRCDSETNIEIINNHMKNFGQEYDHGNIRKGGRLTPNNTELSWKIACSTLRIINSMGQIPFLIKWNNLDLHPTKSL